jgi:6-hydroxytryprostatin B O-methyltransferase
VPFSILSQRLINLVNLQGKYDVYVLNALNHFRVFEHVPLEDKISYEDLAAKTGLPVSRLYRILRHAMTHRTFYEPAAGYVAHTANSAYVHKSPSSRAWIAHNVEEINHSLSFANEAIEKWGDDSDPARTGFALAFDLPPETSLWQFFQTDGEGEQKGFRARRFGQAMSSMSESTAFSNKHLHNLFDWKSLGKASVVDARFQFSYSPSLPMLTSGRLVGLKGMTTLSWHQRTQISNL